MANAYEDSFKVFPQTQHVVVVSMIITPPSNLDSSSYDEHS